MSGPIESLASDKPAPPKAAGASGDDEPAAPTVIEALKITLTGPGDTLSPTTWGLDLHDDLHGAKKKKEQNSTS